MIKTITFRIKDKNKAKILETMSRDVNFVWNVLNSASRKRWNESKKYFHKYDPYFTSITKGASEYLSINSQTIQAISTQFHKDIFQAKKQLRFKGRRSSKWIPFNGQTIKLRDNIIVYNKINFRFWKSLNINGKIKSGSFTRDKVGKWFVNLSYETNEVKKSNGIKEVGLDLGLKSCVTTSEGRTLDFKLLKEIDKKISKQQRAKNDKRVKVLHIKKTNIKNDKMNKFILDLVRTNNLIGIGDVTGFTKGKLAKSRYLNSWSSFKSKLEFKCLEYQVNLLEVDESYTTQTCNVCRSIEGPKGIKELSVRFWKCSCGAELNRDINAAINILGRAKCLASGSRNHSINE